MVATGPLLVLLFVTGLVHQPVNAACRVRLDIDDAASTFTFGGTNSLKPVDGSAPITAAITDGGGVKGFAGALFLDIPSLEACPTTQEAWLAALPAATLTSDAPFWNNAVTLYPPVLEASTLGFPFRPQSVSLAVTGTLAAAAGTPTGVTGSLDVRVSQGWLYSKTPFTDERYDNIADMTGAAPGQTGTLTFEANVLTLDIPALVATFVTPDASVEFLGKQYNSTSSLQINGRLLLAAQLGCTQACGDKGKCVLAAGVPTCQCECGWAVDAQGACTVPGGALCSRFLTLTPPVTEPSNPVTCPDCPTCPNVTAPAPAPDASANVTGTPETPAPPAVLNPDANGACPQDYAISVDGTQCQLCAAGFAGVNCATCQSDDACTAIGSPSAQCVRNATYFENSLQKNYTCAVKDILVQSLLGNTVAFTCNTQAPPNGTVATNPADPLVGTSPFCSLTFRMPAFAPGSFVQCTGWGCKFQANTTRAQCETVKCACPNGCVDKSGNDMSGTFTGISGSIGLSCDPPTDPAVPVQACTVDLTGLPVSSLAVECSTSECYDPDQGASTVGNNTLDLSDVQPPTVSDPILAALPLMALGLATLAFLVAAATTALPFVRKPPAPPSAPTKAGPVAESIEDGTQPRATQDTEGGSEEVDRRHTNRSTASSLPIVALNRISGGQHFGKPGFEPSHSRTSSSHSGLQMTNPAFLGSASTTGGPLAFQFLDICVGTNSRSITCGRTTKRILHGLSGAARMGEVTGLMGPSGSGKSTLLNVLAGQVQGGGAWSVEGTISLGATRLRPRQLVRACAYVPQHDLLLKYLTVEESLRCSAALRLGPSASAADVHARVSEVLSELNMVHLRNSMSYRGTSTLLSGGERQRLMIGMELVSEPLLLLLDEPTSGLDSYNALQVLATLRSVAAAGRIVITSLHQPSPVLFGMLDQAMLIARGYMVFQGRPGDAPAAFRDLGLPCDDSHFVAEHMLQVVGDPATVDELMEKVKAPSYQTALREAACNGGRSRWSSSESSAAAFVQSEKQPAILALPAPELSVAVVEEENAKAVDGGDARAVVPFVTENVGSVRAPISRQIGVLTWRTLVDTVRNPSLALMHAAFAILIGTIVGVVYLNVPNNTAGAQNRVGAIFFVINLFSFMSTTALDVLHLERQVVEREMVRRYYSPWLYMALKVLLDSVVLRVLPGALFSSLFYWLMGLRASASAFITFLCVFCTYNSLVGSLGLLCAALCSTTGKALMALNLLLLNFVLFAGFLVNTSSITWALRWICYINPMRYAWQALVVNELQPMVLTLTAPDLPPIPPVKGRLFLDLLGVNPDKLTENIVVLDCMFVGVMLAALAAMALRIHLLRKGRA